MRLPWQARQVQPHGPVDWGKGGRGDWLSFPPSRLFVVGWLFGWSSLLLPLLLLLLLLLLLRLLFFPFLPSGTAWACAKTMDGLMKGPPRYFAPMTQTSTEERHEMSGEGKEREGRRKPRTGANDGAGSLSVAVTNNRESYATYAWSGREVGR